MFVNPIALRMAKTLWSFGPSECNRVKYRPLRRHLFQTTGIQSGSSLLDNIRLSEFSEYKELTWLPHTNYHPTTVDNGNNLGCSPDYVAHPHILSLAGMPRC